jgi:hypothetical protein
MKSSLLRCSKFEMIVIFCELAKKGPGMMGNLPMGLAGVNDFGVPPPPMGRPLGPPPRFCYDDFSQLSGQRPNVRLVRSGDIDSLIIRRKRLEVCLDHSFEHLEMICIRRYCIDCISSSIASKRISIFSVLRHHWILTDLDNPSI